jgi:hypothetical protein
MAENPDKVNCFKCVHFETAWDPKASRVCKLFGFKSARFPSEIVYKSTGTQCEGFEMKVKQK